MFIKSQRLFSVALISFLGIAPPAFSQTDNSNVLFSDKNISTDRIGATQAVAEKSYGLKKDADAAWEAMPSPLGWLAIKDTVTQAIEQEKLNLRYFEEGVKFWTEFPGDPRKYDILLSTIGFYRPKFWANQQEAARLRKGNEYYSAAVNKELIKNWQDTIDKYTRMFLADPNIDIDKKRGFCVDEIRGILAAASNGAYWGNKENLISILKRTIDTAIMIMGPEENRNTGSFLSTMNDLFIKGTCIGLDCSDLRNFVTFYRDTRNPIVKKWAGQKFNLLDENLTSLLARMPSAKGLDVEQLNGKVVLFDFWSIFCSTCIARMPMLRSIHEKYNSQGFEVVSVSIDHGKYKKRVREIERKFGGSWEHLRIGGKNEAEYASDTAEWKKLGEYFGMKGVPQILVFNREGKLVMINGVLSSGEPETAIKELLEK